MKGRVTLKTNDKIHISGQVLYGYSYYRVDCDGVVNDIISKNYVLATLDEVDGDRNVCVKIHKNTISKGCE